MIDSPINEATEIKKLKGENEMLRIKISALNNLTANSYPQDQFLLLKNQYIELERMLKAKTDDLNKIQKELHNRMAIYIDLRDDMAKYCKSSLIYFIKTLKEKARSKEEKSFCKKMQTTINYLIFKLKHTLDKF